MIVRPLLRIKLPTTAILIVLQMAIVAACNGQQPRTSGTNSKAARKEAIRSVPFQQLTAETKNKLTPVLEKPSIYRRLPVTSIDVDPDMFLFLIRQPEVVVNIWQLMGVTQMTVERTAPFSFLTNDGAGAISNVDLVYGTNNKHIYYADGTYLGPLLKRKLKGRAVMILNTEYLYGPTGKPMTKNSLDVFLKVENATVNLVAKTLNPIIGPTADHNFVESLTFVQRLNETTEKQWNWCSANGYRLTSLTDSVRDQFIKVAGTVYERSSRRNTMKPATSNDLKSVSEFVPASQTSAQRGVQRTDYQDFQYGFK